MKKIVSILSIVSLFFSTMQISVFATGSKIESITFEDVFVYEGTGNLVNGNYIYGYSPNYSVTLSDGTIKKCGPLSGFEIDGILYTVKYSDTQAENPWTPGNTYTATGTILGVSGEFNITVYERPITNIEFDDITFAVGDYYSDADPKSYDGKYDISEVISNRDFRVTEKNGTVRTVHGTYYLRNKGYQPRITSDLPVSEWKTGNVYQVTGTLFGISNTFNIYYEENPIQSIKVDDLSIVEHSGGSWQENRSWYLYFPEPKNITINYKNGDSISGTRSDIGNKTGYWVNNQGIDQYNNHWELGGTYKAKATYRGVSTYYHVNIIETPIASIEISDISIIEGTQGYQSGGTYIYNNFYPTFKVNLKDGRVFYSNGSSVYIDNEYYSLQIDNTSQYQEPWVAGKTYEVTGSVLGVSDTFNVTITESPIASIEISDISIIEGTHGYQSGGTYIYNVYPTFKVNLKDGRVLYSNGSSVYIDNKYYSLQIDNTLQYQEPWVAGKTYKVTGSILGVSDTFNVTITDSPIASIEIEDISIIEGTQGYQSGGTYIYNVYPTFKVNLKDGRVLYSNGSSIYIDNEYYSLQIDNTSQYPEPWVAGKTYEVTGSILGVSDTFNVTITEPPFASIEIEDTSIIEGFNCKNGIYSICIPPFKVKLKDGRELKSFDSDGGLRDFDGNYYSLSTNELELQQVQKWELGGTYKVTGIIGGASTTFNVTVKENPIKSLKVEDVEFYESTAGYTTLDGYSNKYYHYSIFDDILDFKAELKDGSIINPEYGGTFGGTGTKGIYIDNQLYSIYNISDNQNEEHWGVGTHKATAELLGMKTEFNVNIIENPIADVKIKDVDIYKQLSYSYEMSSYRYILNPIAYVTYSNGETIKTHLSSLSTSGYYDGIARQYYNGRFSGYLSTDVYSGNYDFSVTINGKDYPFKVNVCDDAIIKSIECIKSPLTIGQNRGGNLNGAKFKIIYSDETFEEVAVENDSEYLGETYILSKKLNKVLKLESQINNDKLEVSLGEIKIDIPISFKENDIKQIELETKDNRNVYFVITHNDNSIKKEKILNIKAYSGWFDTATQEYKTSHSVIFRTEYGYYAGGYTFTEDYYYATITIGKKEYKTNTLYGYNFFASPFCPYNNFKYVSSVFNVKYFDGNVTAKNIDWVICQSIYNHNNNSFSSNTYLPSKITYNKTEIDEMVKECFKVNNFNINMSKRYDSKNDIYLYDERYSDVSYNTNYLLESDYVNGEYRLKYFYSDDEKIRIFYMTLSDDLRIIGIDADYSLGDVNRDGIIDIRDLIALKKRIAGKNTDDIEAVADLNKDGKIDFDDITMLKKMLIGA